MNNTIWGPTLIIFLHDLATAVWIGGLVALAFSTMPAVREVLGKNPQSKGLLQAIQKRQGTLIYISMGVLVVTGLLLNRRSPQFSGLFSFADLYGSALSLKHILVLAMIAVGLYRSLILGRIPEPGNRQKERLSAGLVVTNLILGGLVLLVSAFIAAVATPV